MTHVLHTARISNDDRVLYNDTAERVSVGVTQESRAVIYPQTER